MWLLIRFFANLCYFYSMEHHLSQVVLVVASGCFESQVSARQLNWAAQLIFYLNGGDHCGFSPLSSVLQQDCSLIRAIRVKMWRHLMSLTVGRSSSCSRFSQTFWRQLTKLTSWHQGRWAGTLGWLEILIIKGQIIWF